jgi:hypothetical protein
VVLNFVSSGERDADADKVTGISGTLARKYAAAGNEQGFQQATGVGPNIKVKGMTLYQATRAGLGIVDQLQPAAAPQQAAAPVSEKMMPASHFVGSDKNKLGVAGQWRNKGPKKNNPARSGDLVGGSAESINHKQVPVTEEINSIMSKIIDKIIINERIQNNKRKY